MKYERDKEYALKVIDSYLYGTLSCVGNTKVVPEKFTTIYRSAIVEGDIEIVEDEKEKNSRA